MSLTEKVVIKLIMFLIEFLGKNIDGFYPLSMRKEIDKLLESEK